MYFHLSFSKGDYRTPLALWLNAYYTTTAAVPASANIMPLNNTHPYAQIKMLASSNKLIFVYIILFFNLLHPDLNTVHSRKKHIDSISIKVIFKSTELSYLINRQLKTPIFKAGFLKNIPKLISPYGFLPFQMSHLGDHVNTSQPFVTILVDNSFELDMERKFIYFLSHRQIL